MENNTFMDANPINDKNAVFKLTKGGFLSLDFGGEHYDRVEIYRLFPFTDPNKYISIRTTGDNPEEIGIIMDMKDVSKETAEMIERQLSLTYFTPVITKIIDIKDEYGYAYFHVVTDKGECRFTINMGSNSVNRLGDERILILDIDENRFEIRNLFELSTKEQRKLDLFL